MEAKNSDSKSQDPICQLPEFEKSTFKHYLIVFQSSRANSHSKKIYYEHLQIWQESICEWKVLERYKEVASFL